MNYQCYGYRQLNPVVALSAVVSSCYDNQQHVSSTVQLLYLNGFLRWREYLRFKH
jgi:hypothetical protein